MREITEEVVNNCRMIVRNSGSVEAAIKQLREFGFSKIDTIKTLMMSEGLSLGDAKRIVHLSETWSDRVASDDQFVDGLETTARKITDESKTP